MNGATPSRSATKLENLSIILSKLEKATLYLSRRYVSNVLIFKAAEVHQFKCLGLISVILSQMYKKKQTTFGRISLHN